jgi:ABC-type proline/glycine betaine transport system substrate-binding protein
VVTQNFLDQAGTDAINFIKDRIWSSDVLNRQLDEMESNQMNGKAAAISFLKTKTNVWREWVNEEAFKKITASL